MAVNKDWKESLLDYLIMYIGTPHSVAGRAPSELFSIENLEINYV